MISSHCIEIISNNIQHIVSLFISISMKRTVVNGIDLSGDANAVMHMFIHHVANSIIT
jgi:hypothetical protein